MCMCIDQLRSFGLGQMICKEMSGSVVCLAFHTASDLLFIAPKVKVNYCCW